MAWTERLTSGRYRGSYRTPDGRKRHTDGTYTHKAAAQREAARLEADSRTLGWRDPQAAARPWGEWAGDWFTTRTVEASTQAKDRSRLTRLNKKWGDTPIHEITRYAIKAWASELRTAGLSPSTVQRHISLLSASLSAAADAEIIPANPALRLGLGLVAGASERTLDAGEQHRLFAALTTDFDRALVATLLGSGARWGEAVALGAQHFHPDGIRYRRAWDNANHTLKPYTKGKRRRTVPLAPWLDELTQPLREAHPRGYLFASASGDPVDYSNWHKRSWLPAVAAAELNDGTHDDSATIHTLRHTYATEQLEDGRSLAEIADLLGHSTISMAERYAHRRSRVSDAAAAAIRDPRTAPPSDAPPANVTRVDFRARR